MHGAAAAASVRASKRYVGAAAIDDAVVPFTQSQTQSRLSNQLGAGGVTTDSAAWTNRAIVDFARDSPMTRDGMTRLNNSVQAVRRFTLTGPSFRPGVPVFQLSGAQ